MLAPRLPLIALAALAIGLSPAFAEKKPPAKKGQATAEDLSDEALFKRHQIPPSALGYILIDPRTGQRVQERNPKETFVPASSIKILTTVAALAVLGPNHRFETHILGTGQIAGGVLQGDLVLRGGGDPMLTSDELAAAVERLKELGITRIAGKLIYDSTLYPTAPAIDGQYEESAAYNPGLAALSLNFNRVKLKWEAQKDGTFKTGFVAQTDRGETEIDFLAAGVAPPGSSSPYGLVYKNDGGKPTWLIIRHPKSKPKGEIWVPVKNPDYMTAHVFRKIALARGLTLPEPLPGATPTIARTLHKIESPPLTAIVQNVQRYSNNMAAELLGLAVAAKLSGKGTGMVQAGAVLKDWFAKNVPGADWSSLFLRNQSGLAKDTKISPEQMAAVLSFAARQRFGEGAYRDLLRRFPIGGDTDTAKDGKAAAIAKTGTINFSRSVAGYLHTAGGRDLIFAVFVSDYKTREVAAKNGGGVEPANVRGWMSRARELQRSVVRRWAEKM